MIFNRRKKTVEVQLAGRRLVLDPLPVELYGSFRDVCGRLALGVKPPKPPNWYQDLRTALSFVFLAAKEHDPKLDLSDLGRPTVEDSAEAIARLLELSHKHCSRRQHAR
jgi:hypothetical protein